jgi:hypothetical protein
MSNQLLNKYAEIISSLKASNGIKVVSVEEINDNVCISPKKLDFHLNSP